MNRRALLVVASLGLASCDLFDGINADQVALLGLIRRVELRPGVDALDSTGATVVGTDWRTIRFHFTEPMSDETVASFDPASHLSLSAGLALDPSSPPRFNEFSLGGVPAKTILRVTLLPMGEGTYEVILKSQTTSPLVGESGDAITGTFPFDVDVIEPDGTNPYLVQFRPQERENVSDEISRSNWIGGRSHGLQIAPHARLSAVFSERMRTPVPVDVEPKADVLTAPVHSVLPLGVHFEASTQFFQWSDSVEGLVGRQVTVLESESAEGMEADADYSFTFFGGSPATAYQARIQDRSGEPFRVRFDEAEDRELELADMRFFRTAPVRVNAPLQRSFVNAAAFTGPTASIALSGELSDRVAEVRWATGPLGGREGSTAATTRVTVSELNAVDVPIDRFSATWSPAALLPDGDYQLTAYALGSGGEELGFDRVVVTKDTVAPTLVPGGSVEMLVTSNDVPSFCVRTPSGDAASAELYLGGVLLATASGPVTVGLPPLPQFCFPAFALPPALAGIAGVHALTIRLIDAAGNAADFPFPLVIRPVLLSVSPIAVAPFDSFTVRGHGLSLVDGSDFAVFDGANVSLSGPLDVDFGPDALLVSVAPGSPDVVTLRLPEYVASGDFALVIDGAPSTTEPLSVCGTSPGPLTGSGGGDHSVAGDLVLGPPTLFYRGRQGPPIGPPDPALLPAGPVYFFTRPESSGSFDLVARTWHGESWGDKTIREVDAPSRVLSVSAARRPGGNAAAAYVVATELGVQVEIVEREAPPPPAPSPCVGGSLNCGASVVWRPTIVAMHGFQSPEIPSIPEAVGLAFTPDGRAVVAYVAPAPGMTIPVVWVSIEREPASGVFDHVAVDTRDGMGGALSVAVDSDGNPWIAYAIDSSRSGVEDLTIHVRSVHGSFSGGFVTRDHGSPGSGLSPSISVHPTTGVPEIAFLEGVAQITYSGEVPTFFIAESDDLAFATLSENTWLREVKPPFALPQRTIAIGRFEDLPNLNRLVPRVVLRRDGPRSRVIFGDGDGAIYVATRRELGLFQQTIWSRELIDVAAEVGPGLSLVVDGAGDFQAAWHDPRMESIRHYDERDLRAIVPNGAGSPLCGDEDLYVTKAFDLDFDAFVRARDDASFDVLIGVDSVTFPSFAGLGPLFTALERNRVEISATRDRQFFELRTTDPHPPIEDPFVSTIALERFEAAFNLDPDSTTLEDPFARLRIGLFLDRPGHAIEGNELEIRVEDSGHDTGTGFCCQGDVCDSTPAAVNGCFVEEPDVIEPGDSAGFPLILCVPLPGLACIVPGAGDLAQALREHDLPLIPRLEDDAAFDAKGVKGKVRRVAAIFDGDPSEADLFASFSGNGRSPGKAVFEARGRFEVQIRTDSIDNLVNNCDEFTLDVVLSSGRLQFHGPPAFEPRDGDPRRGRPIVAAPDGRISVGASNVDLDASDTAFGCGGLINNVLPSLHDDVADAAGDPSGGLKDALNEIARGLGSQIFTPLLEEALTESRPHIGSDAREGVVLFVGANGRLNVVHQPPFIIPLPQAVSHAP